MSTPHQPAGPPIPVPPPGPPRPQQPARREPAPEEQGRDEKGQQIIIMTTSGTLVRVLAVLGWIGFFIAGLTVFVMLITMNFAMTDYFDTTDGLSEEFFSGSWFGSDKVAIIDISGVIVDGDGFLKQQVDYIKEDDSVKAVVVRIDSPGGTVTGSDYIYHHLTELRTNKDGQGNGIPLVVSMGGVAASGGYYVAMAVGHTPDTIYAEPTTTTGSIGVMIPHYDLSGLLERYDVKDDSYATHDRKLMLSMTRQLSEEQQAEQDQIIGEYLNDSFTRFKSVIKSGRKKFQDDPAALDVLATGEIFSAENAKQAGLIDADDKFLEDAVDRAIQLANLNQDSVRVVRFERPASAMELLGADAPGSEPGVAALMEISAPRAWYAAWPLPAMAAARRAE